MLITSKFKLLQNILEFFFLSIEIFENKDFAFEYMNIYALNDNF